MVTTVSFFYNNYNKAATLPFSFLHSSCIIVLGEKVGGVVCVCVCGGGGEGGDGGKFFDPLWKSFIL